jgi:chlorobactene glucosyltransferase
MDLQHGALLAALGMGVFVAVVFPLNLLTIRRLSARSHPVLGAAPRVSVIIPARNEEREISEAVRSHLSQDYPNFEVIVVDDQSTDGTREILDGLRRGDSRLRIARGKEPPEGWLGKPHALYLGACEATGEILLFVDADVRYDPRTLREAVGFLERRRIDFLALFPGFAMEGFWEKVLMPYIAVSYFFGLGFLANSDRHRWVAAGGGAGNMVRRRAYEAAGGHAAIRTSVIDDVRLAMSVKRAGFRCRIVEADDRVRVRMYRGFGEIFDGFTKNIAYIFQGLFGHLLIAFMTLFVFASLAPVATLLEAIIGFRVPRADLLLAGGIFAFGILMRAILALYLRYPLWTALTQPLMAAVWGAIMLRSLYWRFVRREVLWRGRRYDAAGARF